MWLSVCACARECVRVCVSACVRACVCVCVGVCLKINITSLAYFSNERTVLPGTVKRHYSPPAAPAPAAMRLVFLAVCLFLIKTHLHQRRWTRSSHFSRLDSPSLSTRLYFSLWLFLPSSSLFCYLFFLRRLWLAHKEPKLSRRFLFISFLYFFGTPPPQPPPSKEKLVWLRGLRFLPSTRMQVDHRWHHVLPRYFRGMRYIPRSHWIITDKQKRSWQRRRRPTPVNTMNHLNYRELR